MPKPLRILVAPSGFKESLGPDEVADCIEEGIRRILPPNAAHVRKVPLHDGGEGFSRALVAAKGGVIRELTVTGPVREPVPSHYGIVDDGKTAVLDMAAAAGLRLVPTNARDPTTTTTFGVGQLLAAALDEGCTKVVVGCGDSGTSDGGAGMLQALGARLFDAQGQELPEAGGGASLERLDRIDLSGIHPRLRSSEDKVQIEAVCNIKNVLCGPNGVARVYGPQKGATAEQVERLSLALERLAKAAGEMLGEEIGDRPGSGASGGLGTGLLLLGARLRPRSDAADDYFGLDAVFGEAQPPWDVVITGEGSLDSQSARGKMTAEVARRATGRGAKVMVLAGTIGEGAACLYDMGITSFASILDAPTSLERALREADRLLRDAAESSMRMVLIGLSLKEDEVKVPVPVPVPMPMPIKKKDAGSQARSMLKIARAITG
ncbi:glycerate kinase [Xylariomycetidae sp. FL0641]|nr:glycerate kinase [Xylariomycetidae sp. FL0641]